MHLHQDLPASSGQWLRRHGLLNFITTLYEGDLHAKRVLSLANATLGVLTTALRWQSMQWGAAWSRPWVR